MSFNPIDQYVIGGTGVEEPWNTDMTDASRRPPTNAADKTVRIMEQNLVRFRYRRNVAGQEGWKVRNWEDLQEIFALVNPTTFKEQMQAHYSGRPVLGYSQEIQQYVRSSSRKISMELWLSCHILQLRGYKGWRPDLLLIWRNWFEALIVPEDYYRAPALVAVEWPGASLGFLGVLESLNIEYERFDHTGAPIEMRLDTSFLEINKNFIPGRQVRNYGVGQGSVNAEGLLLNGPDSGPSPR